MGDVKIFAVTGNPIFHSKSPLMFNALFKKMNINATYTRAAADSAEEALFLAKKIGFSGMNVTAPFKESIIPLLDRVSSDALLIGAVNTVVFKKGLSYGYNTDHLGVTESLNHFGVNLSGKRVLVLGAGGAARAALFGLKRAGALVTVVNRTYEKARLLAEKFDVKCDRIENVGDIVPHIDVVLSTVSAAEKIVDIDLLRPEVTVFDANYKDSKLAEKSRGRGLTFIDGLSWLLHQALPAFIHFFGKQPDIAVMREALLGKIPEKIERKRVALIGFMASGKSSVGALFKDMSGLEYIDTDSVVENVEKMKINEIFKSCGEPFFREAERRALQNVFRKDRCVVSCGGGVVLDRKNRELLKEGALVVWLYSTAEITAFRISGDERPLLNVETPVEVAETMLRARIPLYAESADIIVNSSVNSKEIVAGKIYEEIGKSIED